MIDLPNEHFNAQIYEQAPGEWHMTLRIEVFNSYWTSLPCKLEATDQASAKTEAQLVMVKLWNLLENPMQPEGQECTRCGVFWEDHDETDHVFKDKDLRLHRKPTAPAGNDSVTSP
jgi:hypothetical protein